MTGDYDRYVRAEWQLLSSDPSRVSAARDAVAGISAARVLDVGCGAGQELRPFLAGAQAFGVGVDISPEVGRAGRELFAREQPSSRVAFVRCAAERLPFGSSSFDVVICRLALPYTDNAAALGEMARVLRPGGALFLKFHHARYYALKLRAAIAERDLRSAIHSCRVLAAGSYYHVMGKQLRGRLVSAGETFQTMWLLRRELRVHDLEVRRELDDSVPAAPSLLIMHGRGAGQ